MRLLTVRDACRKRIALSGTDAEALEHALTQAEAEAAVLRSALAISPYEICCCMNCGRAVVALPDGLAMCEPCSEKEAGEG